MATASTSGQATFGLGRRKKNPGLLDQIGKFFGGDKKRKSKGSFRGSAAPVQASPRRRGEENAVVHFFRSIVSPPPPKSRGDQRSSQSRSDASKSPFKGQKDRRGEGEGTLSRIFKMGGSRSGSPAKR
ncbi:myelin basic protein isoform X2 [Conger conger]|uniref:myelin basic protein isoform X2 n=1 Tax=Conger conger TaxID=82655 RepID=UPI002A5A0BBA|nr:myelin basic protein isoform X2 [Conger conger]